MKKELEGMYKRADDLACEFCNENNEYFIEYGVNGDLSYESIHIVHEKSGKTIAKFVFE